MTEEEKRANFTRLADARTKKTVDMIRLLGNLADAGRYSWDDGDLDTYFAEIEAELAATKAIFKASGHRRKRKVAQAA